MRKRRGAALPKPYAEMTDKEFRRTVMDECGFDPLPPDPPKVPIEPYTGTDDLVEQIKQGTKVQSKNLVRELVLWLTQAIDGFDPDMRGEILYEVAVRLHRATLSGRRAAVDLNEKKTRRAKWNSRRLQQRVDEIRAEDPSLKNNTDIARRIKRRYGGEI